WSSHLLWYAKSRPNGKLIHNSILNGPYLRRMIPKPGDANREPEWSRHVTIVHQTKDFHTADYTQLYDLLKYNQKEIAQPGMNMGQDRQMQMVGGYGENQFRQYDRQNAGNLNGYNAVQNVGNQVAQNPRPQNVGNQNRLIGVQGNGNQNQIGWNQNGNGNLVAVHAEGNAAGHNGNQIRCYNYRGVEEYDLMAAATDLDEIKEVNANCILMANLQQASTSAEVHDNCDNNEIFNMFTQEEQYIELLEPIPEPQQVPQNNTNVISKVTSMEQGGEIVEQHPANFEETRALYESLYQNLA
nr:hypothetical protein [Tanacetum cinerariifolium]